MVNDDDDMTRARDGSLLAAEYALGLMSEEEAEAFEVLLSEDDGLRAELARWSEDFARFTDGIPPETPPAEILGKVKDAVYVPEVDAEGFVTLAVNHRGPGANDPALDRGGDGVPITPTLPERIARSRGRIGALLDRLGLLPAMAGGVAAALAVLWVLGLTGVMDSPQPSAVARLEAPDSGLVVTVSYADDGRSLEILRSAGDVPEGQSLELWLLRDGVAPVSLGLLPVDSDRATLEIAYTLRGALRGASCAISVEPEGGSPTGTPTGPVVAVAPIVWST